MYVFFAICADLLQYYWQHKIVGEFTLGFEIEQQNMIMMPDLCPMTWHLQESSLPQLKRVLISRDWEA